ncbi:MAG: LytTR family DNA-binding domain-containing protein [Cytophagales bacterium]|nr:LytTR family DNA-binding domain-containing protein [Cytophagales bacterium]
MLRTVIIEDEPLVANDLKKMLGELLPDAQLQGVLTSVKAAKKWFAENPEPDLAFVDIQLADGVSFEIFTRTDYLPGGQENPVIGGNTIQCPVIFTTAYSEYAVRAFKLNSIDYLLKPIDREELKLALDKFQRLRQNMSVDWSVQITRLLRDLQHNEPDKNKYKERFMVQSRGRMLPVNSASIACFYRDEIIFLITHDNHRHVSEFNTLEELEKLLNPAAFFRANRQYIVHLNSVDGFRSHATGKLTVYLKPPLELELDISREKAVAFKDWLAGEAQ